MSSSNPSGEGYPESAGLGWNILDNGPVRNGYGEIPNQGYGGWENNSDVHVVDVDPELRHLFGNTGAGDGSYHLPESAQSYLEQAGDTVRLPREITQQTAGAAGKLPGVVRALGPLMSRMKG